MSTVLVIMLSAHVVAGLVGIIAFYAVWMGLLKKQLNLKFLRGSAWVGLLGFVLSWLTGGYYYVSYYGKSVKPVILAGDYHWAHSIITETKEHVFLFLPFLALVILLCLLLRPEEIEQNPNLRKSLVLLAGFTFFLGAAISLAGVLISGAAR